MKPGAIVEVEGRGRATVVYHGLNGYGVVWGEREVDAGNLPEPEALLREPYNTAGLECVGSNFEFVREAVSAESDPRTVRNLADLEREEIEFAISHLKTMGKAADALGISVRTLQRKVRSYEAAKERV